MKLKYPLQTWQNTINYAKQLFINGHNYFPWLSMKSMWNTNKNQDILRRISK